MKCCTRLATLLYRVVSCCMKFDRYQTFWLNKCCTIQHFFCFAGCCINVVLVWPPCNFVVLCSSRAWAVEAISATFLCWLGVQKLKNYFLCKLRQLCSCSPLPWLCFLMFLTCVRLLVLQSFTSFTIFWWRVRSGRVILWWWGRI